jgi:hypothetical protein
MPVGASLGRQPIETCPTILKLHALLQPGECGRIGLMPHTDEIFALDFGRRMHQPMCQLAIGRE